MSTLPAPELTKQPFFKMTAQRAKAEYKDKLITAEAYILYLLDAHRSVGWKWTIEPREFCKTWEIPRSTFYRAISNLKSKGKLNWEVQGKITLWRGADIGMHDSPTDETDNLTNETTSPTDETDNNPTDESPFPIVEIDNPIHETNNLTNEFVVPLMDKLCTQNQAQQGFEKLTDIKQIKTNSTEFVSSNNDVVANAPLGGASPEQEEIPLENHQINEQLEAAASGANIPLWIWQQAYDNPCFNVRVKSLIAYRSELGLKIENHCVVRR